MKTSQILRSQNMIQGSYILTLSVPFSSYCVEQFWYFYTSVFHHRETNKIHLQTRMNGNRSSKKKMHLNTHQKRKWWLSLLLVSFLLLKQAWKRMFLVTYKHSLLVTITPNRKEHLSCLLSLHPSLLQEDSLPLLLSKYPSSTYLSSVWSPFHSPLLFYSSWFRLEKCICG